jgi:ATP-binding cassette, subfamily C, bacterial CydD
VSRAGLPVRRRLLAEPAAARRYLAGCLALELVVTAMILAQAGLLARVLAGAAAGMGAAALAGAFGALLAVIVVRAAASHGSEVTALRAAAATKERLRSRLLRQALDLGPVWLSRQRSGEITTLATTGLDSLDPYFASYLPRLVLAVLVPVSVLVAIAAADWLSGLIVAVTLPLIPLFGVLIGVATKASTRRSWWQLAWLGGHFADVVAGLPTLKAFGRAKRQEQVIGRITEEYRVSVMANLRVAFLSALVLELAASVATALVAVEVGLRLLYGHLGYPTALFVLLLTPEAFLPLRNAAAAFHGSADGTAAAERVYQILDEQSAVPTPSAGTRVPDLRREAIRLEAVSLAYPGREPFVRDIDLCVRPGDRVTLRGSNGAGKTSLLFLLLKYLEPAAGRVLVGDAELAGVPPDEWRGQIGWLPQHPRLFPWPVLDNIALGRPGATLAQVERAAALAGAAAFIARLPRQYETVLDERALRLSAGERQKIALARLFLLDPALVLLDEPAAHLDQASAAELDQVLGRLSAGRTMIEVTHRVAGAAGSGRVLTVEGSRLTESDRPTEDELPVPAVLARGDDPPEPPADAGVPAVLA